VFIFLASYALSYCTQGVGEFLEDIEGIEATETERVSPPSITVSSSEYGNEWGFSIGTLQLRCDDATMKHVVVEANGIDYGLNGSAMGSGRYRNAREIMVRDENGLFTFAGPGDLIRRGLLMCR
jgi:hypothetical protein